jgi:hypothetical protein
MIGAGTSNLVNNGSNAGILAGISNHVVDSEICGIVCGTGNQLITGSNYSFIGGGQGIVLTNSPNCAMGGGLGNVLTDTTTGFIGGGQANQMNTAAADSFIGSGASNQIINGTSNGVVAGSSNHIDGTGTSTLSNCFIGAGVGNTIEGQSDRSMIGAAQSSHIKSASTDCAILSGSVNNIADSTFSTILTGKTNTIGISVGTSAHNVIINGDTNTVTDCTSCVLVGDGGTMTSVSQCFGGGKGAKFPAGTSNSFVWSDSSVGGTSALGPDSFTTTCSGGAAFYTSAAGATGVTLAAGGGAWVAISDRNKKENLVELNYDDVLSKVHQLPIYQFNYKTTSPGLLCRGPMAQDWHQLFPSEKDPLGIDTLDLDGISLAAIKALIQEVQTLKQRVVQLESNNSS